MWPIIKCNKEQFNCLQITVILQHFTEYRNNYTVTITAIITLNMVVVSIVRNCAIQTHDMLKQKKKKRAANIYIKKQQQNKQTT